MNNTKKMTVLFILILLLSSCSQPLSKDEKAINQAMEEYRMKFVERFVENVPNLKKLDPQDVITLDKTEELVKNINAQYPEFIKNLGELDLPGFEKIKLTNSLDIASQFYQRCAIIQAGVDDFDTLFKPYDYRKACVDLTRLRYSLLLSKVKNELLTISKTQVISDEQKELFNIMNDMDHRFSLKIGKVQVDF